MAGCVVHLSHTASGTSHTGSVASILVKDNWFKRGPRRVRGSCNYRDVRSFRVHAVRYPSESPSLYSAPPSRSSTRAQFDPAGAPRDLSAGLSGPDVQKLQLFLHSQGFIKSASQLTGYYGPATEAAVKAWQAKHNLPSTGRFGPMSRAKMAELNGSFPPEVARRMPQAAASAGPLAPSGTILDAETLRQLAAWAAAVDTPEAGGSGKELPRSLPGTGPAMASQGTLQGNLQGALQGTSQGGNLQAQREAASAPRALPQQQMQQGPRDARQGAAALESQGLAAAGAFPQQEWQKDRETQTGGRKAEAPRPGTDASRAATRSGQAQAQGLAGQGQGQGQGQGRAHAKEVNGVLSTIGDLSSSRIPMITVGGPYSVVAGVPVPAPGAARVPGAGGGGLARDAVGSRSAPASAASSLLPSGKAASSAASSASSAGREMGLVGVGAGMGSGTGMGASAMGVPLSGAPPAGVPPLQAVAFREGSPVVFGEAANWVGAGAVNGALGGADDGVAAGSSGHMAGVRWPSGWQRTQPEERTAASAPAPTASPWATLAAARDAWLTPTLGPLGLGPHAGHAPGMVPAASLAVAALVGAGLARLLWGVILRDVDQGYGSGGSAIMARGRSGAGRRGGGGYDDPRPALSPAMRAKDRFFTFASSEAGGGEDLLRGGVERPGPAWDELPGEDRWGAAGEGLVDRDGIVDMPQELQSGRGGGQAAGGAVPGSPWDLRDSDYEYGGDGNAGGERGRVPDQGSLELLPMPGEPGGDRWQNGFAWLGSWAFGAGGGETGSRDAARLRGPSRGAKGRLLRSRGVASEDGVLDGDDDVSGGGGVDAVAGGPNRRGRRAGQGRGLGAVLWGFAKGVGRRLQPPLVGKGGGREGTGPGGGRAANTWETLQTASQSGLSERVQAIERIAPGPWITGRDEKEEDRKGGAGWAGLKRGLGGESPSRSRSAQSSLTPRSAGGSTRKPTTSGGEPGMVGEDLLGPEVGDVDGVKWAGVAGARASGGARPLESMAGEALSSAWQDAGVGMTDGADEDGLGAAEASTASVAELRRRMADLRSNLREAEVARSQAAQQLAKERRRAEEMQQLAEKQRSVAAALGAEMKALKESHKLAMETLRAAYRTSHPSIQAASAMMSGEYTISQASDATDKSAAAEKNEGDDQDGPEGAGIKA
eukprot:jgi/Mesvir1/1860/Mv16418-RA.1